MLLSKKLFKEEKPVHDLSMMFIIFFLNKNQFILIKTKNKKKLYC